jgi:hypothetical protein
VKKAVKSETLMARDVSEKKKVGTGANLANALEEVELTPKEAKSWYKNLIAGRKVLKPNRNKWL